MTSWLLKLLDARAESGVGIAGASVEFRGALGWGGWVLWLVLLGAGAYFSYRLSPAHVSRTRRALLTSLRILFIGGLLMVLLRPVIAFTVEGSVRRLLVVLIDNSASLKIPDPRTSREDQVRAAIARDVVPPDRGLGQTLGGGDSAAVSRLSRLDLVKGVLQNPRLNLLPRLEKQFDIAAYEFGGSLNDLFGGGSGNTGTNAPGNAAPGDATGAEWAARLDGRFTSTALGDVLKDVANRKRGQPMAGIWLVTDGANNSGSPPLDAAERLRGEGIPLYAYGVGLTSPRDAIVSSLLAPEVTFIREELDISVRVRGQGLAGQQGLVKLQLGTQRFEQTVTFTGGAEQVVTFHVIPEQEGELELEASIPPRTDEAVTDNNLRRQRIKVIDSRINILLVDQSPRWEFRYLQAMLLRDRRVALKCYLVEGDPAVSRVEGSPYIPSFPSRREDLLKFDLVIFGDVDPRFVTPIQQEYLNELVSKFGGALLMVAGKRFTPQAYRRSVLYPMLPVEYDSMGVEGGSESNPSDKPIRLELSSAGRSSPMMRLGDNEARSLEIWKSMPPVYWVSRVSRLKPAAESLLVDSDPARETRFGKMPVVSLQQYGLGQVMFVGTDNTWRWRKNSGDAYYTAFWGQLVQRLALPRLLGGNKRIQLTADRQNYLAGDRVTIFARLYSGAFEAIVEPVVKGRVARRGKDGAAGEVLLRPLPDQPGLYRGEFIAGLPGDYGFTVEQDPDSPLEFTVIEPQFELGETSMNEPLLQEMAKVTGGSFLREENLNKLPEMIQSRTEKVRSPLEVELWSSPLVFLILMALLTAEWVVRKLSFLK